MANNFIEQNKNIRSKKKIVFGNDDKYEVEWTKPLDDDLESQMKKDISNKEKKNVSNPHLASKKKAKILTEKKEKNSNLLFANFLSFFNFSKKNKLENFEKKKKDLSVYQEKINKEKEEKDLDFKNSTKSIKKHKDIGEIVQEKLKENKITIDDGTIIKTNLMEDGPTILIDWERNILFLSAGIFFALLLVGVFYGFLFLKKQNESLEGENLDQEIEIIQNKIENEKKGLKEINILQKKLLVGKDILDKHVYWTNFFEFLEKNTLANVYYQNGLSGNTEGSYTFKAITDNYRNITEQLAVLRDNDLVIEADVAKGSMSEKKDNKKNISKQEISFDLNLKVKPEIFYK